MLKYEIKHILDNKLIKTLILLILMNACTCMQKHCKGVYIYHHRCDQHRLSIT